MFTRLLGLFLVLHGLVHGYYVALSAGWIPWQADMFWTGRSPFSQLVFTEQIRQPLTTGLFIIATCLFVLTGGLMFFRETTPLLLLRVAALFSTLLLLLYIEPPLTHLLEKGLIGIIINLIILATLSLHHL